MEKFLAARKAVIDRHKTLESVQGSGWHPADPGMREADGSAKTPLSARPVAVINDDQMVVCGDCCKAVHAGLKKYLARGEHAAGGEVMDRQTFRVVSRLMASPADPLVVSSQEWNCVTHALAAVGVQCVTTQA